MTIMERHITLEAERTEDYVIFCCPDCSHRVKIWLDGRKKQFERLNLGDDGVIHASGMLAASVTIHDHKPGVLQ